MVIESSGVSTLLNQDRISRDYQVQSDGSEGPEQEAAPEQTVSDVATFSPQALALSRSVVEAGETSAQSDTAAVGRGQEAEQQGPAAGSLNIVA
ncbi:MAG: hypothetical protein GY702_01980 [Desulfobulbaceae bacterium]|nr:hypothetical protein [Desulfobulbaceae bacterium]